MIWLVSFVDCLCWVYIGNLIFDVLGIMGIL